MNRSVVFSGFFAVLLMFSACSGKQDRIVLQKTSYTSLPGWQSQDKSAALSAFRQSCDAFHKKSASAEFHIESLSSSVKDWQSLCKKAERVNLSDTYATHRFFEQHFEPYLVSNNGNKTGIFTGYYEPLLKGSRRQYGGYQYPLYRLPPDVKSNKAYYDRREIDKGTLRGRGLELVYVDDPVQAFFLHIQGSGRVLMDNGSVLKLGYAGKNNQKYFAIGRYLKEKGYIPEELISAQSIKHWLYTNPTQAQTVMEMNPSYVFFRELDSGGSGPIGGQGVPLTARASLAVDKQYIPYGMPLWLNTTLPDGKGFSRLMIAQDTGGAIKGPVRGDIFFGFGDEAEHYAGLMKNPGSYIALWPKRDAI